MNDGIRYDTDIEVTVLEYQRNSKDELLGALCSVNANDFREGQEVMITIPAQTAAQSKTGAHGELEALLKVTAVWKVKNLHLFRCERGETKVQHDLLPSL